MSLSNEFLKRTTVFGLSVSEALSWVGVERDLDVCELWAGVGSVVRAAAKRKLATVGLDISSDNEEDFTCLAGFRKALHEVQRLRRGGLLIMGPPCSTFVWMSSSVCKRSEENDFDGEWENVKVHGGNFQLDIALWFFTYAYMRSVVPALENPQHSFMWKCARTRALLAALVAAGDEVHEVIVFRCAFTSGGPLYRKPFKFLSTGDFILAVERSCTCTRPHAVMTVSLPDGRCRGDPVALAESASYPPALGEKIVDSWLEQSGVRSGVPARQRPGVPASHSWASCSGSDVDEPAVRVKPTRVQTWAGSGSESEPGTVALRTKRGPPSSKPRAVKARSAQAGRPDWGSSDSD